ncbi:DNA-binding protein [Clostridium novyi A str. 4552]|uniref:DNA-binding protein n=1 Tax=Clostridium novyi A str. 4552 TaxID=1444289 RepID=A0A0A0I737_CLONO|nr:MULTISPECIES: DeoR/GlpR family DNA-binding transcription regulator [Clostridium]EDS77718.1 DNA-binding protein IolR [Clostridium botulinum C str. Eklund]KEH97303.1 DNA-binding protein [Clostridium botulinum C/D str. BKT12695]KGM96672.1 DNA-binding protein [Clostridium novyi A str. 4552]NEZ49168.1 DeoR/GlpR transcriptional regulator [Clostridium botulinum]
MKSHRIKEIENYILQNEHASIDTLCSLFNVSKNTIRRDITVLEQKGIIKKVYGGITLNNEEKLTVPFEQREVKYKEEKYLIAKSASELVEDNDIIFIDSGTTTVHMIPFLNDKKNLTIITNNLNILMKALPYSNVDILSTGGTLFRETNSLIGIEASNFLKNYNISKAFMATTGFSIEKGVTNSSNFEYDVKKTVVENSSNVILLADHSKLDTASLKTYCNLEDIDCFITDKLPPKQYVKFFEDNSINLIIPNN